VRNLVASSVISDITHSPSNGVKPLLQTASK
jgi:hypothetical protein